MAPTTRAAVDFLLFREDYSCPSVHHCRSEPYDVDPGWYRAEDPGYNPVRLPRKKYTELSHSTSSDIGYVDSQVRPSEPFPVHKLPLELTEKIIKIFLGDLCPLLTEILDTGCIPINSEPDGLHTNSDLVQYRIRIEQEKMFSYMRISKLFFEIITQVMIRGRVYISGTRAFQRLIWYSQIRSTGTLGDIQGIHPVAATEDFEELEPIVAPLSDASLKDGDTSDVTEGQEEHTFDDADFWVKDRFGVAGDQLEDSSDASNEQEGSSSDVNEDEWDETFVIVDDHEGVTFDVAGDQKNWGDHCDFTTAWHPEGWELYPGWLMGGSRGIGGHINKEGDMEPDNELPANLPFMETIDTLIIGSDPESWRLETELVHVGDAYEEWPDLDSGSPALYTLAKALQSIGETPMLRKLVMAGNIMKHTFWLMPREIGGPHQLSNLTHLTLSISESATKYESPLNILRCYLRTPQDAHICNLLTGRGPNGKLVKGVYLPFLGTLKHLHLRGPGAHVCSNIFRAKWRSLENLVVEMGTHRGICNGDPLNLMKHASNACKASPKLNVYLAVRICDPELEYGHFRHHWWRHYIKTGPMCPTISKQLGTGQVLTLFRRSCGAATSVAKVDELRPLLMLIRGEMQEAMLSANRLALHNINVLANGIWAPVKATQEDGLLWLDEGKVVELRSAADALWEEEARAAVYYYWVAIHK